MSHEAANNWDVDILGIRVSAVNMEMALRRLEGLVDRSTSSYVCVTGVHGIIESQNDADLRAVHNNAAMVTPDGMPTVWCGKWAGAQWMERVYGPDLLLAACEYGLSRGWRHFFYGGSPGVAERLTESLRDRFPNIQIVGHRTPPFRQFDETFVEEETRHLHMTNPDIVWIGLSTPKQEKVAALMASLWTGPVFISVGAAFDFHAGLVRQCPRRFRHLGLEWLFRLVQEPRRLGPRYGRVIPRFLATLATQPPQLY